MSEARFIVGDVREVLATLPDDSVDLVFTSPPFLALRSYLPADHPDKAREIGSEPDPGAFIDTLLGVTEDLARVLAPHGSLCVELGDTYSGSGGHGGDYDEGGLRDGQPKFDGSAKQGRRDERQHARGGDNMRARAAGKRDGMEPHPGWPPSKSACLIPELYRLSLAYGRNPLTGRETPRWRIRNTVTWARPNPPVGALGDKFRPATSDLVVACKARDRYFDLDAVRTEREVPPVTRDARSRREPDREGQTSRMYSEGNSAGAPPLDWWKISTHGYPGAHYATFPPSLVTIPLLSMCPERVCRECGQPSRRIVGEPSYERTDSDVVPARLTMNDGERPAEGVNQFSRPDGANTSVIRNAPTLGWTDCGHNAWRRGIVLDPFGGSGTVAEVATGHGRDAILIDIDSRNADLAVARIGMLVTVETPPLPGRTRTR